LSGDARQKKVISCYSKQADSPKLAMSRYMIQTRHELEETTQAEGCNLPEFKKMARGIRLDYSAVKAAFSSE
jgi:hypothetical protein